MEIDIIDLSLPEYQDLTREQREMVRLAQIEKEALLAADEAEKRKLFYQLLERRTARGTLQRFEAERIGKETEEKIEELRQNLIQQMYLIAENTDEEGKDNYRYPNKLNMELPPSQRLMVVENYYLNKESDPATRLAIYTMDTVAKSYLGDLYETLYEILAKMQR